MDPNKPPTYATEDEIKNNPNAIVYDPYENSTPSLPDVPTVLGQVEDILKYMVTDDMMKLRKDNFEEFEQHMEQKFSEFSDRYYALFQKLLSGEDISPLMDMFATIEKIKSGKVTMEKGEEQLGKKLYDKFVGL
jgi:hypothetical protein